MFFSLLKNLLFPKTCLGCGKLGVFICLSCQKKYTYISKDRCPYCEKESYYGFTHINCKHAYGIDGVKNIFQYEGVIKKIITYIKYRRVSDAIPDFLSTISRTKREELLLIKTFVPESILLPVPLHKDRQALRGFNQADKFAHYFSDLYVFPVRTNIVVRTKNTPPQALNKTVQKRHANMINAFCLLPNENIKGQNFIIIDDVWTTGATTKEIGEVLKRNGAEKVYVVTIAA